MAERQQACIIIENLRPAVDCGLIPENRNALETLLTLFLLDKAVYELGYELNNRPDWVTIPVRGIRYLVESADGLEKERG